MANFTNLIPDMKREIACLLTETDLGNLSNVSKTVHFDLSPEMVRRKIKYTNRPPSKILENGIKIWTNSNGLLHHLDGPAVIHPNGDQEWCCNGKLDRKDGPAAILSGGDQFWIRDNLLHREDGPAVILEWDNGDRYKYLRPRYMDDPINEDTNIMRGKHGDHMWFTHGKLNRLDDLPAVVNNVFGYQSWWVNDECHRIGNPAVIHNSEYEEEYSEEWWMHGQCNREDGPAITGGVQPVWSCANNVFFYEDQYARFMQTEFHPGMYKSRSCPTVDRLLTPSVDNNGMLKDYDAFPGLHF